MEQGIELLQFPIEIRRSNAGRWMLAPFIWDSSLRGLSGGLKNRRMVDRYHSVPPDGVNDTTMTVR